MQYIYRNMHVLRKPTLTKLLQLTVDIEPNFAKEPLLQFCLTLPTTSGAVQQGLYSTTAVQQVQQCTASFPSCCGQTTCTVYIQVYITLDSACSHIHVVTLDQYKCIIAHKFFASKTRTASIYTSII